MDKQYIDNCKYLLLARCSCLERNLDPSRIHTAVRYADRLLEITPRDAFYWNEFEKYLDFYCFGIFIGDLEWSRESIRNIEKLASDTTECTFLF